MKHTQFGLQILLQSAAVLHFPTQEKIGGLNPVTGPAMRIKFTILWVKFLAFVMWHFITKNWYEIMHLSLLSEWIYKK